MVHLRFDGPHERSARKRKKEPPPDDGDDDRDVVFAPAEGPSANEVRQKLEAAERERLLAQREEEEAEPEIDRQISLRQVFVLMTLVSIGLAGTHWFPAKMYSFACGLAALIGLGLLSLTQPVGNAAYLAWGAVMLVYVISIFFAGLAG